MLAHHTEPCPIHGHHLPPLCLVVLIRSLSFKRRSLGYRRQPLGVLTSRFTGGAAFRKQAYSAMQYLVDLCTRFWKLEQPTYSPEVFDPDMDNDFKEYCRRNSDILKKIVKYLKRLYDGMPAHGANLISLLRRPYWTRLWVLQEVQLASDLLVICGSAWLPRQVFQLCLCLLFQELSLAEWGYLNPIPNFWVLDTSVIQTLRRANDVKMMVYIWFTSPGGSFSLKLRSSSVETVLTMSMDFKLCFRRPTKFE